MMKEKLSAALGGFGVVLWYILRRYEEEASERSSTG